MNGEEDVNEEDVKTMHMDDWNFHLEFQVLLPDVVFVLIEFNWIQTFTNNIKMWESFGFFRIY